LRRVATCWVLKIKLVRMPRCNIVARDWPNDYKIMQHPQMLHEKFEPTTPNMSQHITTGWPNARNMLRPTMLRCVVLKCCDRLAEACKCWANNTGVSCAEMLQSFGRSLQMLGQQCCDIMY